MEKYVINSGKVSGKVVIDSAKNAVLPMIAGAVLTEEQTIIKNCPKIVDVISMLKLLKEVGISSEFVDDDLVINAKEINGYYLPYKLTKTLRTSVLMMGALLGRCGKATLHYPGGCEIGERPINLHISSLKKLGVSVLDDGDVLQCSCSKLQGESIRLNYPSVGATENLLLASVKAEGITKIYNYAKEPEVIDFINMLNQMGARISVSPEVLTIEGVSKLHGVVYKPIPDRIEAGTFILSALITKGEIEISNVNLENILPLVGKFYNNTCNISIKNDIIYLKSGSMRNSFNVITGPHPLFPTDLQAQTAVLATVSKGESKIVETVFENRFGYALELIKMGAKIKVLQNTAYIKGVKKLQGAKVTAKDLRGGAALVLAGLCAEGQTEVLGVEHVERGYYNFDKKLEALNISIKRTIEE